MKIFAKIANFFNLYTSSQVVQIVISHTFEYDDLVESKDKEIVIQKMIVGLLEKQLEQSEKKRYDADSSDDKLSILVKNFKKDLK